jgi:hypothetical protein
LILNTNTPLKVEEVNDPSEMTFQNFGTKAVFSKPY